MTRSKAFTMIELSIVVLIIGVLVAGTLKVRTMIDRANQTVAQRLTGNSGIENIEGLEMWLETTMEDSFGEIYDGAPIGTWNDLSKGSAKNNATQTTQANKPIYEKNAFTSGIPGLKFDGDDFFEYAQEFLIGSEYTIFIVDKRNATAGNGNSLLGGGGTASTGHHLGFQYALDEGTFYFSEYGPFTVSASLYPNLTPIIHSARFSKTSGRELYKNGNLVGSLASDTTPLISLDDSGIGGMTGGYKGHIGEVIMFSTALTNAKRQEVEEYLSKKYNITLE